MGTYMYKFILAFISIIFISGCAPSITPPKMKTVLPKVVPSKIEMKDWPKINERTTVSVGDRMLIQGYARSSMALSIKNHLSSPCYQTPAGTYGIIGQDESYFYFFIVSVNGAVTRSESCEPFAYLSVPKDKKDKVCVATAFGMNSCYASPDFEITETTIDTLSGSQKTLLYSGLDMTKISFQFVEHTGTSQPFYHTVSYDLGISDTIAYRGAKIKIHNATNENITYTVLKSFSGI
ncbi:MAG: hypothetical protein LBS40_08685 [Burkholderiales bacterium]|jgi:hypothetical protein|nr:hypothetical protein [Burkholderiales bacterium]